MISPPHSRAGNLWAVLHLSWRPKGSTVGGIHIRGGGGHSIPISHYNRGEGGDPITDTYHSFLWIIGVKLHVPQLR